jgi:Undecaprenyl-phosphate glucose phosphotransferase
VQRLAASIITTMSTNYVNSNIRVRAAHSLNEVSEAPARRTFRTIPYRAIAPLAMVCDALLIFSASLVSDIAYNFELSIGNNNLSQFSGFAAVVAALFIAFGKSYGIYTLAGLLNIKSEIRKVTITWIGVFLFLTAIVFVMKEGSNISRGAVLLFAVSGFLVLIAARGVWRIFLADGLAVRRFANRKIAVIEEQLSTDNAQLVETLNRHGLEPAFHFVLPSYLNDERRREEVIDKFISSIHGSNIEEIIVATGLEHWSDLSSLLAKLRVLPLPVNLIPMGPLSELFNLSSHSIGDTTTVELQHGPRTLTERAIKRVSDILVASAALVVFIPLLLITAIAIKLDSPGPIIFRQRRRGFNGRPFQILKFRTMSVLEDGEKVVQAERNDVRITRFGNWLRRTSIDELPQLINVLEGSMSVVGPRPHAMAHDTEFDKLVRNYAYRHHVKPGLTGWAQVNGFRGQTRTIEDVEQRIKLDLWYIDNWSLAVDVKILFMTATEVIFGKNAY